jgi:hypothetical protein
VNNSACHRTVRTTRRLSLGALEVSIQYSMSGVASVGIGCRAVVLLNGNGSPDLMAGRSSPEVIGNQ